MSNRLNILQERVLSESDTEEKKPWYSEGLKFKCTGCGQCCTGAPGYVWITIDEIIAAAAFLNISADQFKIRYVRKVGDRYSLTEYKKSFDCIFLKDKKCQIYSVRPEQCRTFPWWLQNLKSEYDWNNASKNCEGINHPDASTVPYEHIQEQFSNL